MHTILRSLFIRLAAMLFLIVLVMSFVSMGTPDPAIGQLRHEELPVVIYGRVQWLMGAKMVVAGDCRVELETTCNTASGIAIDLMRVDASEYRGITQGTWVLVEAFVRHENASHRFVATSIKRVEEWGAP